MPPKDKYTDPKLRDEVKEDLQKSDKGGAPGQWSARKAQMMAKEYKNRGGDYNTDKSKKDESQKNLSKWGDEEWQTKEGSANAKQEDGSEQRYLPKKAWEKMSEKERKETDDKKQKESKKGKQHVSNTGKAKDSRKKAQDESEDDVEMGKKESKSKPTAKSDDAKKAAGREEDGQNDEEEGEEDDHDDNRNGEEGKDDNADDVEDDESDDSRSRAKAGDKRKGTQAKGSSKKQKGSPQESKGTIGSKHMAADEPAPRGSNERLPKKGQKATWKAMPGYVDGIVVEVLKANKDVDGKMVKASKDEPRVVLKSSSSGKICVHKADACFYE